MQRILRPYTFKLVDFGLGKLGNVPDYAELLGDDPTAALTVLSSAVMLAIVGWMKLPKASGLRLVAASQLLFIYLLAFVGLKAISQDIIKGLISTAAITGLTTMVIYSKEVFHKPATVVATTFIIFGSIFLVLPGTAALLEDSNSSAGMLSSFFVLVILFMTLGMFFVLLIVAPGDKDVANQKVTMKMAATFIVLESVILVLSQLA